MDRVWRNLPEVARTAITDVAGLSLESLWIRGFKVQQFNELKKPWDVKSYNFRAPEPLDMGDSATLRLQFKTFWKAFNRNAGEANLHPYLGRSLLSSGELCTPSIMQVVMNDMDKGGNIHVKLPSTNEMNSSNDASNPHQTEDCVRLLLLVIAYYATELLPPQDNDTIYQDALKCRLQRTDPPSFQTLKQLWNNLSSILGSAAALRHHTVYKKVLASCVEASIDQKGYLLFFIVMGQVHSTMQAQSEQFNEYHYVVAQLAENLRVMGVTVTYISDTLAPTRDSGGRKTTRPFWSVDVSAVHVVEQSEMKEDQCDLYDPAERVTIMTAITNPAFSEAWIALHEVYAEQQREHESITNESTRDAAERIKGLMKERFGLEVNVLQYAMRKFAMTETERKERLCPEEGLIAKRQPRAYRTVEDQFIEQFMKSTVVTQAKEQNTSVELAMRDWRDIAGDMSLAEALTLGDINNRYIRYAAVEVEPIDTAGKDDGLCFYELLDRELERSGVPRQQRRAMMDQSRTEVTECRGRNHTAMLDSGAATVCISRKTVESLGIKVRKDPRALVVSGFQGGEDTTKEARMEEIDYVVCH